MPQTSGHTMNNSAATMLVPDQACSSAPSPVTTSSTCTAPAFASSSITLSQRDHKQAYSQALGESLPQILAAFQSHSSPSLPSLVSRSTTSASPLAANSASVTVSTTSSATYLPFPSATGNINVPSFISTYCTLGNSSLPATSITGTPSLSGARSAPNRSLSAAGQSFTPTFAIGSSFPSTLVQSQNRPFIAGPGYSPIPEKLVSKIRSGHFIDLADLLMENLKAQETEPQTYLDGKLLVSSTKKRVQEITDIVTWIEAFTVYSWILCSANPSRRQDTTQYKLLILKTARQFSGKAWSHYDITFRKDAAVSGLVDWSHMNLDLYNFHTRASPLQSSLSSDVQSPATSLVARLSNFCRSWNDGTCPWSLGQCRFRHSCERCEGQHPRVNCPFQSTQSRLQRSQSANPSGSKCQRR